MGKASMASRRSGATKMGGEDRDGTQRAGREQRGPGRRWAARRSQNGQLQLTLVVAPESLILGFLGVEVFELSKVPDSVPQ